MALKTGHLRGQKLSKNRNLSTICEMKTARLLIIFFMTVLLVSCESVEEFSVNGNAFGVTQGPIAVMPDANGTVTMDDVERANRANQRARSQMASYSKGLDWPEVVEDELKVAGFKAREGNVPLFYQYVDSRDRVITVPTPSIFLVGEADALHYVKRRDQVSWISKTGRAISGVVRDFFVGKTGLAAVEGQTQVALGSQSVEKARIGAEVKTTEILSKPTVTTPEQVVTFPPRK